MSWTGSNGSSFADLADFENRHHPCGMSGVQSESLANDVEDSRRHISDR
jgi:hypothetical protein